MKLKLTILISTILLITTALSALSATAAPPAGPPEPTGGAITTGQHSSGAVMVFVPAGDFIMGSAADDRLALPREQPQRTVYLDAFWIDQDEVTNTQYNRCVAAGACQPGAYTGDEHYNGDNQPVVGVDWAQAAAFCAWTGRALPTEAQWEKAARGLEGQSYAWGNDPTPTADVSPFGMRATANQVWEWTADWRDEAYYSYAPNVNPTGPAEGRLRAVRGGAWNYLPPDSRVASRTALPPAYAPPILGFRCVAPADAALEPMSMELAALADASPLSAPDMPGAQTLATIAEVGGPRNYWFLFLPWNPFAHIFESERASRRPPAPAPVIGQSSSQIIAMEAGSTITVTTTTDDTNNGNCTLREAIDAANLNTAVDACQAGTGDDTIILPAGVYSLTLSGVEDDNNSGDLDVASNMTILGDGAETTIIHANGQERVFEVAVTGTLVISGVTITGGNAALETVYPYGGGIAAVGGLTLTGTVVGHNRAEAGGGLDLAGNGPYYIADSEISHNTAEWAGGGIYNESALAMTGSVISANTVTSGDGYGGGLENDGGEAWLDGVIVQENSAGFNGGGIENYRGFITLTDSYLLTNTVVATSSYGGGLSNYEGVLATLDNVLVQGNRAGLAGAGIDNSWGADYGGKLDIYNSTILSNSTVLTDSFGAGLSAYDSTLTLLEDTLVQGNRAGLSGGIDIAEFSLITLRNCEISGNEAWAGNGFGGGLTLWESLGTLEETDILDNMAGQSGGGLVLGGGEIYMTGGSISGNVALGDGLGGGLLNFLSYAVLNGVDIEDNRAGTGGGIANLSSTNRLMEVSIRDNQATGAGSTWPEFGTIQLGEAVEGGLGGGLYNGSLASVAAYDQGTETYLVNSSLTGNSAAAAGGGVSLEAAGANSTVYFTNINQVTGNTAPEDEGCYNPSAILNISGSFTDDSGTCVQSQTEGSTVYLPVILK